MSLKGIPTEYIRDENGNQIPNPEYEILRKQAEEMAQKRAEEFQAQLDSESLAMVGGRISRLEALLILQYRAKQNRQRIVCRLLGVNPPAPMWVRLMISEVKLAPYRRKLKRERRNRNF